MCGATRRGVPRSLLMVMLLSACGDAPTRPALDTASYSLTAVEGQVLPATLFEGWVEGEETDFHLRIEVVEGALEIRAGDRYTQRLIVTAYIDGIPDQAGPVRWTDRGVVSSSPTGSLRFESTYIQNVSFDGSFEADGLAVRADLLRHFHDQGAVSQFAFRRHW